MEECSEVLADFLAAVFIVQGQIAAWDLGIRKSKILFIHYGWLHETCLIAGRMCWQAVAVILLMSVVIFCRVTLEDLYNGCTTELEINRKIICAKCKG